MRDIHTDLVSVWEKTWSHELRATIAAEEQQRAHWTFETLAKWGASKDSMAAAVIAPILSVRPNQRSAIAPICGESSALLAEHLLDLRRSLAMGAKVRRGQGYKPSLQALGRLFREAYIGLPSLSFILLLLADHDSRLRSSPVLSFEEAQQTQRVFAPLAEMLGIWSLYRSWNEKSSAVLFPQQYSDISRLLGPAKCYSKSSFKKLFAASIGPTSGESQLESPDDLAGGLENKSLLDKAEAFLSFRKSLMIGFSERGIKARIVPIKIYPGLSLRQVREGESREEVARRLRVRIHCRSVSDCYSVLGIIHSLGKPVSHTSLLYLKDQIASPQPNAYRAIHDAITYRDFKKNGGGSVVVECRILTGEMFRVNEDGVLALLDGDFSQSSLSQAWWNQLGELNRQLQKRAEPTEPVSIQSYLKVHEPSSVSDPLYVFTPRGEIVLLPQGSTPLDYAYSIHRKMGHHAIRVEVNGQNVSHGYSLRNADIVRIHHDPAFLGPDLSWLWLVATHSARASIRQGLTWRANAAHDGRAYFEKFLLRSLDRYEREKGYRISVTTERVDDFLLFKSRLREFAEVSELYSRLSTDQLNKDSSLVQDLVQDLLSEEFASHITTSDGNPLPYELEKVLVCPTCFPIPGERIVGFRSKSLKKLVVHKVGRQSCVRDAKAKKEVRLEWATRGTLDQNELNVFRVKGLDRPRLLREVIDAVYKVPGSYLYRVNAQRFGDSHADISMVVKARGFDEFAEIEKRLRAIGGVTEIMQSPPSPSQQAALTASTLAVDVAYPSSLLPNPYTSEEVFQRGIFYDRQSQLSILHDWLREELPTHPMILHGQRRIGKTSLVKYLMYEYLPSQRLVQPVFVDLQGLDEFAPRNVANFIVSKVFKEIEQPVPPRSADEETLIWLDRALTEALKHSPRLLIIIDEFNVLIDLERQAKLNPVIYDNIRYIMNTHRNINWLLVVQDTHFLDKSMWLGAGVLFQRARELQVMPLEKDWARRLILEPTRKCGIVPERDAAFIDEMLRLTGGSPFLIHLMCRELIHEVRRQGRSKITSDDITTAAAVINHAGKRWYNHYMRNLTGLREVVMAAVALSLSRNPSVEEPKLVQLLTEKLPTVNPHTVRKILVMFAQEGLIAVTSGGRRKLNRITIPTELFRRFIVQELDLDESIERYQTATLTGSRVQEETNAYSRVAK